VYNTAGPTRGLRLRGSGLAAPWSRRRGRHRAGRNLVDRDAEQSKELVAFLRDRLLLGQLQALLPASRQVPLLSFRGHRLHLSERRVRHRLVQQLVDFAKSLGRALNHVLVPEPTCLLLYKAVLSLVHRLVTTTLPASKASRAPAAVHSAGVDRPGHGTSHGLQNGGLFTFTRKVCITYDCWNMKVLLFMTVMDLQHSSLRVNLLSKPLL